jgi:hypothetical protein
MKQFSFSDMNRLSGEILENTLIEPVALTKYGRERLVILSAERYRQMVGCPRVAFTVEGAPRDVHDELVRGLDALIEQTKADD